jgi:hypothetical protein
MSLENFWKHLYAAWMALCGVAATSVFNEIMKHAAQETVGFSDQLFSLFLAFLIFTILASFPFLLLRISFLRINLVARANIEGFWLQLVDSEERPYSISILEKNILFGWRYEGYAYGPQGAVAAHWKSMDINFDEETGAWLFRGRSRRFTSTGQVTRMGNVLSVLYWKDYDDARKTDPKAGLVGRIADLDYDDRPVAIEVRLIRLTPEVWREIKIQPSIRLKNDHLISLIKDIGK